MTPEKFVIAYYPHAKASQVKTGIHPVATLAQAALESGWGEKAPGNMFFGVKAKPSTPADKKQLIVTTEFLKVKDAKFPEVISVELQPNKLYKYKVKDWFMKYDSPEESFSEHNQFFIVNKRYAEAMKVAGDYNRFFEEIAKAGYATAPGYADTLKAVAKTIQKQIDTLKLK
jgi:flagellum-specific peptidoglycan hydrolase FlgJ